MSEPLPAAMWALSEMRGGDLLGALVIRGPSSFGISSGSLIIVNSHMDSLVLKHPKHYTLETRNPKP